MCYYLIVAFFHSIAFEGKLFVYKMEISSGDAALIPVYHSSLECHLNPLHAPQCRSVRDLCFKLFFIEYALVAMDAIVKYRKYTMFIL